MWGEGPSIITHVARTELQPTNIQNASQLPPSFSSASATDPLDPRPDTIDFSKALTLIPLTFSQHWEMMRTGETPHVRVGFSYLVATSCFLYLGVAYCYHVQLCPLMALLCCFITVTSLVSDSLRPSSRAWCSLDRALATLLVFLGPIRAMAFHADSYLEGIEILSLSIFSLLFLAWSRSSSTQNQFAIRHTLWHLVSASSFAWLAINVPSRVAEGHSIISLSFINV